MGAGEPTKILFGTDGWRAKIGATPNWYKARNGVRTRALSGAARVARFRPPKAL